MILKKILIIITIVIGILITTTSSSYCDDNEEALPLEIKNHHEKAMASFKSQSGFIGDYILDNNDRIFTDLYGTFPLPTPKDSLSAAKNAEYILSKIIKLYESIGIKPELALYSYKESGINLKNEGDSFKLEYVQKSGNYWFIGGHGFGLAINYIGWSGKYTVDNNLYLKKINIPAKIISFETVQDIVRKTKDDSIHALNYTYINSSDYSTGKARQTVSNDYRDFRYSLGLYPVDESKDSANLSYELRWHIEFDYGQIIIDPATGKVLNYKTWLD